MESLNLSIENWQGDTVEEISYSISLKVPCKNDVLILLPTHLGNLQYCWQFHTGILSSVQHSLKLCLYREYHEPKIGVYVSIKNDACPNQIVEIRGIDITYISTSSLQVEDELGKTEPPKLLEVSGVDFWQSTCGWPDQTSMVLLVFHVARRKPAKIINDESAQLVPSGKVHTGSVDVKSYFLSEDCADVRIQCGPVVKYPAHRLILSSRSKYFSSMFSSSMKECKEGVIKIEDMDPPTVKELLRFIYLGEIESMDKYAKDLYIAGDKYGMDDLKGTCERYLLDNLTIENAMETYDLCQIQGSPLLLAKTKEIIMWNKGKFIPDPDAFRDFTCKYPELMFELFQFQFQC